MTTDLEAELALTFIQSAKLYSKPADSERALGNARKALTEIRERLAKRVETRLTDDEIVFLETRCSVIESQLQLAEKMRPRR
jgi:cob(I)alamin adenosyltransferase